MKNIEIYYNTFRLAVNTEPDIIIEILKKIFVDFKSDGKSVRFFTAQNHHVEIYKNEDYDSVQAQNKEEGFLYFRTNIDITVIDDFKTNPNNEMQLAKFLKNGIEEVVLVAEFE